MIRELEAVKKNSTFVFKWLCFVVFLQSSDDTEDQIDELPLFFYVCMKQLPCKYTNLNKNINWVTDQKRIGL